MTILPPSMAQIACALALTNLARSMQSLDMGMQELFERLGPPPVQPSMPNDDIAFSGKD